MVLVLETNWNSPLAESVMFKVRNRGFIQSPRGFPLLQCFIRVEEDTCNNQERSENVKTNCDYSARSLLETDFPLQAIHQSASLVC